MFTHHQKSYLGTKASLEVQEMLTSSGSAGNLNTVVMLSTPVQQSLTFKAYWLRDAPTVQHSTTVRSAHTVFMCFVFI